MTLSRILKDGESNRIQISKIFKRGGLSSAAEILFEIRSRAGEFDLDIPARQTQKTCDGKYHSLFESFKVGGGTNRQRKHGSIRLDVHGGFVLPEAQKKYGKSC